MSVVDGSELFPRMTCLPWTDVFEDAEWCVCRKLVCVFGVEWYVL